MNVHKISKIAIPIAVSTLVLTPFVFTTSAFAAEYTQDYGIMSQNTSVEEVVLTDMDTIIAGKYISINQENLFVLNPNISQELTSEKVALVQNQISQTNKYIEAAKQDTQNTSTIISPSGQESLIQSGLLRGAGVNSITFHWNYARIKISAGSLRNALLVGFTAGSVYAPAKIVQLACGIAGIGTTSIKNGIWFDYNYFVGVLTGNAGKQ
ncbi:hypothetical protein [Listeria fleischmannii]|uniref:Uncharacterized protein n=1 Tax=Listeria fleischmannii FSL S10-1203 TaxID=1265822 RepID=W7CWW7_9LIST|nr:hypothetical protein [Listeria fleischmannii]EUJ44019.1 hypothetical protein MCOL2_20031 [Listeria fleischmannii FSL S10-1203]